MKLKNKLLLSIGTTISVVVPVATVVSCGSSTPMSVTEVEERELWAKAQNAIETKYQEMLIGQITKNHSEAFGTIAESDLNDWTKITGNKLLKEFVYNFIKENIYQNNNYLTTFADELIHTVADKTTGEFYKFSDLQKDGFYSYFETNVDVTKDAQTNQKIDDLVDKYFPIIWEKNIQSFQNQVYKAIISYIYLDTSKENWRAVFVEAVGATDKINAFESNLASEKYVLGQKILRGKYAYDWNITLTDAQSRGFSGVTKTEAELNTSLEKNGDIFKLASLSKQKAFVPSFFNTQTSGNDIWSLLDENKNLAGFTGISAKANYVPSDLTLVNDQAGYDKRYEGYIDAEKANSLDNDSIKLTRPDSATVNVEKLLVIMPEYVGGQLVLNNLKNKLVTDKVNDEFNTLKQILLSLQGANLYTEAIKYYSSKDNKEYNWNEADKTGGIRLKIENEPLRKMAIDSFGLDYIEKDE